MRGSYMDHSRQFPELVGPRLEVMAAELRLLIAERRAADPDWQPNEDERRAMRELHDALTALGRMIDVA